VIARQDGCAAAWNRLPRRWEAIDATDGFAYVLAGMKAWLEHGIELNLVRDRHRQLNESA
jgi:hypothetical protein